MIASAIARRRIFHPAISPETAGRQIASAVSIHNKEVRMWGKGTVAFLLILSVAVSYSVIPSAVSAQGKEYGKELKEAGKEYGRANKEAFKPADQKERSFGQKVGHGGKSFGKGTGKFFTKFGKGTGRFFKDCGTKTGHFFKKSFGRK